jgi:dTDP-glucose 4,6-dehydratase
MNTLLVIGGTGFFGKSILDGFARGLLKPWNVTHVIIMSRHAELLLKTAPQLVNQDVTLISSDVTIAHTLPEAEYVIHAAASTDLRDYVLQPEQEELNIKTGTYHYCELAKKCHVKSKIVYVSSGAVYGAQPSNVDKLDELYLPHDFQLMDAEKRSYAGAKRDSEVAIVQLGRYGLDVSIARCFAFVGSWLPRDQHFAIGNFIEDALNHRVITVKTQHKVYRSYMYADDLVEWLMTIADHASKKCPIYNVGSDQEVLITDVAREIAKEYFTDFNISLVVNDRVDRYIPNVNKAKDELGLTIKFDIHSGIKRTIEKICSLT